MPAIRLESIDASHARLHATSLDELASQLKANLDAAAEYLPPVLEQMVLLFERLPRSAEWGAFLAIDEASSQVIGTCAYKTAPSAAGEIEIAYYTFPPFESRGYATEMARELTRRGNASPRVKQVIAHTLPERNASCRALEKAGYENVGQVVDPEDGPVWRWEYRNTLPRDA